MHEHQTNVQVINSIENSSDGGSSAATPAMENALLGPPDILGLKRVDLEALPAMLSDLHYGMPSSLQKANIRILQIKVGKTCMAGMKATYFHQIHDGWLVCHYNLCNFFMTVKPIQ